MASAEGGSSRDELLTSTSLVSEAASVFGGKPGNPIKGSDATVPAPPASMTVVEAIETLNASVVIPPPPVTMPVPIPNATTNQSEFLHMPHTGPPSIAAPAVLEARESEE